MEGAPTMVSATTGMDPIQHHVGPLDRNDTSTIFVLICLFSSLDISYFIFHDLISAAVPKKPKAGCKLPHKGEILTKKVVLKSFGTVSAKLRFGQHVTSSRPSGSQ